MIVAHCKLHVGPGPPGHLRVAGALLNAGADPTAITLEGKTPFDIAASRPDSANKTTSFNCSFHDRATDFLNLALVPYVPSRSGSSRVS